ncbi:hypothetical protein Scep_027724 [Stephania cephalantha]|uniref:Uncharacterized protein n=1 Tax=Stephania cephalantha TaxID=152367 RepID=A0AAP0EBV7_9MAGN
MGLVRGIWEARDGGDGKWRTQIEGQMAEMVDNHRTTLEDMSTTLECRMTERNRMVLEELFAAHYQRMIELMDVIREQRAPHAPPQMQRPVVVAGLGPISVVGNEENDVA